jgi:hypothetical protein
VGWEGYTRVTSFISSSPWRLEGWILLKSLAFRKRGVAQRVPGSWGVHRVEKRSYSSLVHEDEELRGSHMEVTSPGAWPSRTSFEPYQKA